MVQHIEYYTELGRVGMVVVINFSFVCVNSSSNFVSQGHFDMAAQLQIMI